MGRRKDHKPDPRIVERIDPHTRQRVKSVRISASSWFNAATRDRKLDPSWDQQTVPKQRGKKPDRTRSNDKL